jgi:hypothetical protein
MSYVGRVSDWLNAWAVRAKRRIGAVPHAPAVAAALLGVLAAAEALLRTGADAANGVYSGDLQIAVVMLSLFTTVPAGVLWAQPAAAALAVSAATVLSLALFHTLTVAGLVVQLVVLYRLGRWGSSQLLAAGLAMHFVVLELA